MTKLDDVLDIHSGSLTDEDELKRHLKEIMLEIIGKDIEYNPTMDGMSVRAVNKWKQDARKEIEKL